VVTLAPSDLHRNARRRLDDAPGGRGVESVVDRPSGAVVVFWGGGPFGQAPAREKLSGAFLSEAEEAGLAGLKEEVSETGSREGEAKRSFS
jgi:hypothetical protein